MGNIEILKRYGKHDEGFGMIDNLSYTYSGNQLKKVTDMADSSLTYYGAFHFVDGANDEEEYTYDANGNMTADLNKGIDEIFYNSLNLPDEVRFASGHKNQYIYDAEGTLTCKYLGIPTNFLFSPMERLNAQGRIVWGVTSRSAYYDNLIYACSSFLDLRPVTMLIDGGYVSLNGPRPQYHFYVQDHLGNNRVVVDETGTVEEVNHYTPFGALMADSSAPSVQPYKYNGKKLDTDNALNWYYYGARYYDAALGRWLCRDPLAEKYYDVSPYAYCGNSPVNLFDIDGREPVYDAKGNRIGTTKEGFWGQTGYLYIYSGNENINWSSLSRKEVANMNNIESAHMKFASGITKENAPIVGNILTDILKEEKGVSLKDRTGNSITFDMENYGGRIIYDDRPNTNFFVWEKDGTGKGWTFYFGNFIESYEFTSFNVASSLIYHEWNGHILNGWDDGNKNHWKCFDSVINSSLFPHTTRMYRYSMIDSYLKFSKSEGNLSIKKYDVDSY